MPNLPSISYLPLQFHLTAQQDCQLREIKGSMLRGAFGHALKRTVCVDRHKAHCKTCMLQQSCIFTKVFETFVHPPIPPTMKGIITAPKPFIINSFSTQTTYQTGDTLIFDMTLLGKISKFYPYIIYSVLNMAKSGLGAQRHPFQLDAVYFVKPNQEQQHIYSGKEKKITSSIEPLLCDCRQNLDTKAFVHFATPTRLKYHGQYTMQFNFRWLVMRILQRVMELAHFYDDPTQAYWDYSEWMDLAGSVHIQDQNLSWHDWQRYSNRQQTKMNMGGFIGDISLNGELEPFSELLSLAQVVHIGKGTSFGLGKIQIAA